MPYEIPQDIRDVIEASLDDDEVGRFAFKPHATAEETAQAFFLSAVKLREVADALDRAGEMILDR